MKLKWTDRTQEGFARYCPTIAKTYQSMREGIQYRKNVRRYREFSSKIPAVIELLSDPYQWANRHNAALALGRAAEHEADISSAIAALITTLSDPHKDVQMRATWTLEQAAKNPKTVEPITKAILEFIESDWYQRQAAENSQEYIRLANLFNGLMQNVKEAA